MARAFRRTRKGITVTVDDVERGLLARLFTEVHALLDFDAPAGEDPLAAIVGIAEHATTPDDPALARLLPDANLDDADDAREFRRFTERGLRSRKQEALDVARGVIEGAERSDTVVLTDEEARSFATALTDVRLVLASRMGLQTDDDAEHLHAELVDAPPGDPRAWLAAVYDFLTWMQETLVTVLAARLPETGRPDRP